MGWKFRFKLIGNRSTTDCQYHWLSQFIIYYSEKWFLYKPDWMSKKKIQFKLAKFNDRLLLQKERKAICNLMIIITVSNLSSITNWRWYQLPQNFTRHEEYKMFRSLSHVFRPIVPNFSIETMEWHIMKKSLDLQFRISKPHSFVSRIFIAIQIFRNLNFLEISSLHSPQSQISLFFCWEN